MGSLPHSASEAVGVGVSGITLAAVVLGGVLIMCVNPARAQAEDCGETPSVPILSGLGTFLLAAVLAVGGGMALVATRRGGLRAASLTCVTLLLAASLPSVAWAEDPAPATDPAKKQVPGIETKRYDLPGATLAEAAENFRFSDPADPETKLAGATEFTPHGAITPGPCTAERKADGTWEAKVTDTVEWKLTFVIHLPKWSGFDNAPKHHQAEWTRFSKAVEAHEDGHVTRSHAALTKAAPQKSFEGTGAGATKQAAIDAAIADAKAKIDAELDRLHIAVDEENKKYDAESDHGAKPPPEGQGAALDTDPPP